MFATVDFDSFSKVLNRPGGFRDPGEPEEYCRGFQVFDKDMDVNMRDREDQKDQHKEDEVKKRRSSSPFLLSAWTRVCVLQSDGNRRLLRRPSQEKHISCFSMDGMGGNVSSARSNAGTVGMRYGSLGVGENRQISTHLPLTTFRASLAPPMISAGGTMQLAANEGHPQVLR